jgi:predicted heme/steroid binding protein
MDKNDFTESLFRKVITEIRDDIKRIETKSNGSIVERMNDKINILEKIMSVFVMKNNAEDPMDIPVINQEDTEDTEETQTVIPDRYITDVELAENNGMDGKPTYVAVDGIVYDVSNNTLWTQGLHFGNRSGRDLSVEYSACHAGRPRLDKLPIVGRLVITKKS